MIAEQCLLPQRDIFEAELTFLAHQMPERIRDIVRRLVRQARQCGVLRLRLVDAAQLAPDE